MTRVLVLAVLLVGVFNVAAAVAEKNVWLGVVVLAGLSVAGLWHLSKITT